MGVDGWANMINTSLGGKRGITLKGERREPRGGGQCMLAPLVRFLMDLTVGSF
jgi:hypothetical protein